MKKSQILEHPDQENKNGSAPFASSVEKNYSANEPLSRDVAEGEKKKRGILKIFKKKKNNGNY